MFQNQKTIRNEDLAVTSIPKLQSGENELNSTAIQATIHFYEQDSQKEWWKSFHIAIPKQSDPFGLSVQPGEPHLQQDALTHCH